jgi:ribonuclease VapC
LIIDASAFLAFLHDEPGAEVVRKHLPHVLISTLNFCEVIGKYTQRANLPVEDIRCRLHILTSDIIPFDEHQAFLAASWHKAPQPFGLSLADRACLALAKQRGLPVLTADRIWQTLDLGVTVVLIR